MSVVADCTDRTKPIDWGDVYHLPAARQLWGVFVQWGHVSSGRSLATLAELNEQWDCEHQPRTGPAPNPFGRSER